MPTRFERIILHVRCIGRHAAGVIREIEPEENMKLSKLPGVSYIRRYWWILVLLYFAYLFARADSVWRVIDVFAYMPLALLAVAAVGLFFRNVFHRKTTDKDVDSGQYVIWYNALPEHQKVWLIAAQWMVYMIVGGLIALGLLIVLSGLPVQAP